MKTGIHNSVSGLGFSYRQQALIENDLELAEGQGIVIYETNSDYSQYGDNQGMRAFVNYVCEIINEALDGMTVYGGYDTHCHVLPYNELTEEFYNVWERGGYDDIFQADSSTIFSTIEDILSDAGLDYAIPASYEAKGEYEFLTDAFLENLENCNPTICKDHLEDVLYLDSNYIHDAIMTGYISEETLTRVLEESDEFYYNEDSEEWELKRDSVELVISLENNVTGTPILRAIVQLDTYVIIDVYEFFVKDFASLVSGTRKAYKYARNQAKTVKIIKLR